MAKGRWEVRGRLGERRLEEARNLGVGSRTLGSKMGGNRGGLDASTEGKEGGGEETSGRADILGRQQHGALRGG